MHYKPHRTLKKTLTGPTSDLGFQEAADGPEAAEAAEAEGISILVLRKSQDLVYNRKSELLYVVPYSIKAYDVMLLYGILVLGSSGCGAQFSEGSGFFRV